MLCYNLNPVWTWRGFREDYTRCKESTWRRMWWRKFESLTQGSRHSEEKGIPCHCNLYGDKLVCSLKYSSTPFIIFVLLKHWLLDMFALLFSFLESSRITASTKWIAIQEHIILSIFSFKLDYTQVYLWFWGLIWISVLKTFEIVNWVIVLDHIVLYLWYNIEIWH